MNKQELIEKLRQESFAAVRISNTGSNGYKGLKLGETIDLINQLDEPQKVKVPAVAETWLKEHDYSNDLIDLFSNIEFATSSDGFIDLHWDYDKAFYDWVVKDTDTIYILADALRYGYEVEEEPKYYVELPFEEWDEDAAELKTGLMYLAFDITSDETRITTNKNGYRDFKTKLDEETIKSIDERFWPFAVPVEKV